MWKYLFEAALTHNGVPSGADSGFGKWDMFASPSRPKPVGINGRKLEWHVDHPLVVNGAIFNKGISIPLNQAFEMELEPGWDTLAFKAGIDDDLYPEVEVTGLLSVEGDGRTLFTSVPLKRGGELLGVTLPVRGVKSLRIRFSEIETVLKHDPDNWADLVEIFCDVVDPVVGAEPARAPPSSAVESLIKTVGLSVQRHPAPAPVWCVQGLPDTKRGEVRWLLGCMDDVVYGLDRKFRRRWRYPTGGLPFSMRTMDVNGDGLLEIGIMALDPEGTFSLLHEDGALLWRRGIGPGLHVFAFGDIDGDGQVEIVVWDNTAELVVFTADGAEKWRRRTERVSLSSAMGLGDINGDGKLEILVGPMYRGLDAYSHTGELLWHREMGPMGYIGHVGSIEVCPIASQQRILVGSRPGRVTLLDGRGQTLWSYSHCGRGHNAALAATGNFVGSGGREVAAMAWDGSCCVLDQQGRALTRDILPMPFLCFDVVPHEKSAAAPGTDRLLAGSAGLRDSHCYLVHFEEETKGRRKTVLPGRQDHVTPHLETLVERIHALKSEAPPSGQTPYHVIFTFYTAQYGLSDPEGTRTRLTALKTFLRAQSRPHVRFEIIAVGPTLGLQSGDASEREMTRQTLRMMEALAIPFYTSFDHGGNRMLGVEAAKEILALAPTACQGFDGSEQSVVVHPGVWERWLPYMEQMLRLCAERGKKMVLRNNFGAWYNLPSYKNAYDLLFSGRHRDVLVALVNANNPANELDVSAVLAHWKSGAFAAWGIGSQHWNWDWYPINIYNLYPPDHMLRSDFVAASLGATYFSIEGEFYDGKEGLCASALKDRVPFYELLKKGVFKPCAPERLSNFSEIVIQYHKPPWLSEFVRTDIGDGKRLSGSMITNFRMQTSPGNYLPRLIYGVHRYFDGLFPQTPYGMVGFLPPHAKHAAWAGKIWRTDGLRLLPSDEEEAVQLRNLEQDLERAARRFPFRAKGCFLAVRQSETGYRLYLCDPAYLDPHGVRTTIESNLSRPFRVWDVLENKARSPRGGQLPVDIKAGVFRVLDVVFT